MGVVGGEPYRPEQARARIEQSCARTEQVENRSGSIRLKNRTGGGGESNIPESVCLYLKGNRTGLCKNRTGGGGHGGESNIPESIYLYLKGNRTGLCKNRTSGGGHGGESKVSIYI